MLLGSAATVTGAGAPGLDQPEAVGAFLNGRFPSQVPGAGEGWGVQRAFPNVNAQLPTYAGVFPGTDRLLLVEKDGSILSFDNDPGSGRMRTVFLNISSRVYSNSDSGMTYFVFHPEFGKPGSPNRGYVYVTYKYSPEGDSGNEGYWRLSRFTVPDGALAADPNSELILIQQYDRQQWHDAGCMLFGPDGFLYVAIGDEGGAFDQYGNSQIIDDRLFSGILRIDVDRDPKRSHPIRRQPLPAPGQPESWPASFTANYYIPNDNPFVNSDGGVLEEFYTLGHRNPYRMSYDPATGEIWVAEVGQMSREEVNRLVKGGNYGWAFKEGTLVLRSPPTQLIGTLVDPLWEYGRGWGGAIVGGGFYTGSEHPSLRGKYLAVDNVSGRIFALSRSGQGGVTAETLASMPTGSVYTGTTTCMQTQDGEIYFIKLRDYRITPGMNNAEIYKLVRRSITVPEPPAILSATGAFQDLATLTPAPGLIPYTVNAPLWSDGAQKRRWIAIPNDGNPNTAAERIGFQARGEWDFPPGTVFVKHFELPNDETDPTAVRRLETRFLVVSSTGEPYGVTYRWREDGSDADLLTDGQSEEVPVALEGGGVRVQTWDYPSRANCMQCHNANAGHVLGVKTHQLNGAFTYPSTGRTANQIETLAHLGFFDAGYDPDEAAGFLRAVPLSDGLAPLETRVRSYLDANCAHCHRPGGVRAGFDARFTTPLASQNLIRGAVETPVSGGPESIVEPGVSARSALVLRDAMMGQGQMPPIARNVLDEEWIATLRAWIDGMSAGRSHFSVTARPPRSTSRKAVVFRGTAEAGAGVEKVEFRVGNKGFRRANGGARWRFRAPLKPGRNVILIRATDQAGLLFATERFVVRHRAQR